MKNIILIIIIAFYWSMITAQVPLAEIEGVLSVFLPDDTTSLHIGRQVGVSQSLSNNENTVVGSEAGGNNSDFSSSSFFGYRAGYYADTYSNSFFGAYAGESTGKSNSQGCCNSFFGLESGKRNDSGSENSFYGQYAGQYNVSGNYNSFYGSYTGENNNGNYNSYFGNAAGEAALEGNYNSFFGNQTGNNNEGDYNNYFGNKAGYWNHHGDRNVAIGAFALSLSQFGGSSNAAIGDSSMYHVDTDGEYIGEKNAALGASSLFSNIDTKSNRTVALGYEAGYDGGSRSVFIGHRAGKGATEKSDVLYVDNREGDDPLIYGEFDNDLVRVNGEFEVSDFARLKPLLIAPECTLIAHKGRVYFDLSDDKLKVCAGDGPITVHWEDLN